MNEQYRPTDSIESLPIEQQPQMSAAAHPDEILNNSSMTNAEKRAILASWASDARAPKDFPALREFINGAIVRLEDILRALRKLDDDDDDPPPAPASIDILAQDLCQADKRGLYLSPRRSCAGA